MTTIKHKKTGQELKKIDRAKRKPKPAAPAAAAPKDDKPAPKQGTLPAPGMAPKVHPDIVDAANELALAREKAKSAGKHAKMRESVVIEKMKRHGVSHYVDRGQNIEITLKTSETVGLKQFDHDDEDTDKLV